MSDDPGSGGPSSGDTAQPPVSPDPQPFGPDPQPFTPGRRPGRSPVGPVVPSTPASTAPGGCAKPLLVGCLVLAVVVGAVLVLLLLNAKSLFTWALTQVEAEVIANLPEEVTPDERRRLEAAFDAATEAVREGEMDPVALQDLQRQLRGLLGGKLTREQILELTATLERVAAGRQPSAEPDRERAAPVGTTAAVLTSA